MYSPSRRGGAEGRAGRVRAIAGASVQEVGASVGASVGVGGKVGVDGAPTWQCFVRLDSLPPAAALLFRRLLALALVLVVALVLVLELLLVPG